LTDTLYINTLTGKLDHGKQYLASFQARARKLEVPRH